MTIQITFFKVANKPLNQNPIFSYAGYVMLLRKNDESCSAKTMLKSQVV